MLVNVVMYGKLSYDVGKFSTNEGGLNCVQIVMSCFGYCGLNWECSHNMYHCVLVNTVMNFRVP